MTTKYTYHFTGDILVINDHGGPRSVTNDMEKTLAVIHMNEAKDLTGTKIVYSDSIGDYDGVVATNYGTREKPTYQISFIILTSKTEADAIEKINEFYNK